MLTTGELFITLQAEVPHENRAGSGGSRPADAPACGPGCPKKRICVVGDALYGQGKLAQDLRENKWCYVVRIKSNRRIRLFDRWMQVKEYFSRYKKERYFTDKNSGKKVYYKEAVLEVSKLGRCKVFSFREEGSSYPEYSAARKATMGARTAYRYKGKRWGVEEMHRALK